MTGIRINGNTFTPGQMRWLLYRVFWMQTHNLNLDTVDGCEQAAAIATRWLKQITPEYPTHVSETLPDRTAPSFRPLPDTTEEEQTPKKLFVVRLFDMFDGWVDISQPVPKDEAQRIYNQKKNLVVDGDYYAIFPSDMTPESLGR